MAAAMVARSLPNPRALPPVQLVQDKEQEIVKDNLGVNWVPGDMFAAASGGKIWLGDDHPLACLDNAALAAEEIMAGIAAPAPDERPVVAAGPPPEGGAVIPPPVDEIERPAGLDARHRIFAKDARGAFNQNSAHHLRCHYPQLRSCPTCCDANTNVSPQRRRGDDAGLPKMTSSSLCFFVTL